MSVDLAQVKAASEVAPPVGGLNMKGEAKQDSRREEPVGPETQDKTRDQHQGKEVSEEEQPHKVINVKNYVTFGKQEQEGPEKKEPIEESEDELELSFELKQESSQEFKSESNLNETGKFNNTFGKLEKRSEEIPFTSNEERSASLHGDHLKTKDILIDEGLFRSESDLFKNKFDEGEQNIEVLDLKFDQVETSSQELTTESRSMAESSRHGLGEGLFERSLKTAESKFYSQKAPKPGNSLLLVDRQKRQRVVSGHSQFDEKPISQKRLSHSSNLEISSLRHLLSNLKRNIFQGKEHFKNKRKSDRKNRFHSNCGVSAKTASRTLKTSSRLDIKKNKSVKAEGRR